MNHLDWIKDTSVFKEVQERIESDCQSLIDTYFHKDDDYAIEKFLKTYAEGLRYLERLALLKRGVSEENIADWISAPNSDIANYHKNRDAVKKIMLAEASRQYRHALTFMSSLRGCSSMLIEERKNFALLENAIEKALGAEEAQKVFDEYHRMRKNHD